MVRGKTEMKRIENTISRQVTFSKRKNGLLKKAYELSVLCDVEVALLIFSPRGKLYEFASSSIQSTIERYKEHLREDVSSTTQELDTKQWKNEAEMTKRLELLETSKQQLLGEILESCSLEELHDLEGKIMQSLQSIRGRKHLLLKEQVAQLKEKEKSLLKENALLREKFELLPQLPSAARKEVSLHTSQDQDNEVETELCIGFPGRGSHRM
ncbi:MADS-box transcription factor 50-like [Canna indica]|uniref:MADS-box transcription factor 50-like n=1 Tax=Canna indica TaxID=4628 RepID=A0AAQ3QGB8_9LILI|nr:MADS-box transcription factor 50-like [Canna indica]